MRILQQTDHHTVLRFQSLKPGKKLLIFGAIHGNEVCGPLAIERIAEEINQGKHKLTSGSLTLVPICNLKAYVENTRYFEKNLNRVIKKKDRPRAYEEHVANFLCQLIDQCDVLLDLHSFHSAGDPFLVWDDDSASSIEFTKSLGPFDIMTGFEKVYDQVDHIDPHTTQSYAHSQGKISSLIECGQHKDPKAPEVAYQAILHAMRFCGLIDEKLEPYDQDRTVWDVSHLVIKEREGKLAKDFHEFEPVKAGDTLGEYEDGEKVTAPIDGHVLFPGKHAKVRDEWILLSKKLKLSEFLKAKS